MTVPEINTELRNLIDARLDEIEAVLLQVSVSYSERHHILGEVEAHIFERLAREGEPVSRERLVAVLESLDPAAAYIPEELRGKLESCPKPAAPPRRSGPRMSRLAIASGILAVSSMLLWFLVVSHWWTLFRTNSLFQVIRLQGISIVLLRDAQEQDWSIVCTFGVLLTTVVGIIAAVRVLLSPERLRGLPLATSAAIVFPVTAANSAMFGLAFAPRSIIPITLTIFAILAINVLVLRKCWQWFTARRHRVAELLRGNVASFRKAMSETT